MEDEAIKDEGAAEKQIESGGDQEVATEEKADTLSAKDVQDMLEKERRNWQSKIDKIIEEKKTEETKALTTEQRLERMEQERKQERLQWSRKEAKAQARLDDELETAILSYSSNDPGKIAEGARGIRSLIDTQIAEYKSKIDELEKQVKYTGAAPKGGGASGGNLETKTEYTREELQDTKIARLVMQRKKAGENITIV